MAFRRKKYKNISFEEVNELLDFIKRAEYEVIYDKYSYCENTRFKAWIEINKTELHITCKRHNQMMTYNFDLDGEGLADFEKINGMEAYATMSRYAKVDKYKDADNIGSAKPLLYKNEKYAGKRVKAYGYDLNSAYSMMLLQPLPDIKTLKTNCRVGKGQIGFKESDMGDLKVILEEGRFCNYVCDLMESPFKRFVEVWYDRKKNAKTKEEKAKAKAMLNYPVGYCQRTNPFIRATIVQRCNMLITSLMDENTIYCNTDSIISAVRRPDLEENLGTEVGQWKLEHNGEMFAWAEAKLNYQWNDEIPAARGIPKNWFKNFEKINGHKFDILTDNMPTLGNNFEFDKNTLTVNEVDYNE